MKREFIAKKINKWKKQKKKKSTKQGIYEQNKWRKLREKKKFKKKDEPRNSHQGPLVKVNLSTISGFELNTDWSPWHLSPIFFNN